MVRSTLCYIENNGKYLMLYRNKKENDMNEGKWLGLGGKIEEGESPDDCVMREVREESGIELTAVHARGLVHFIDDSGYEEDMYLYTADVSCDSTFHFDSSDFTSAEIDSSELRHCSVDITSCDLRSCDEGELRWIDKDKIFALNLWEGDRYFLEKLIDGESSFEMTLEYANDRCIKVTTAAMQLL